MSINLGSVLRLAQVVTPSRPPAAGTSQLYVKGDRKLYLRHADGTEREVGGGGSTAVSAVQVDFGARPTYSGVFSVPDARATTSSVVLAAQSAVATAGRAADENEMEPLLVRGSATAGVLTFYVEAIRGPVVGPYTINYTLG